VPDVRSLHHVGLCVSDLDTSAAFYRDLLGFEVVDDRLYHGSQYDRMMDTEGATGRMVMLQLGLARVELFEFSFPATYVDHEPRVWDRGITHLCLEVSDVHGLYARLSAAGVRFHCSPLDGPFVTAAYCRDPEGNIVELLQPAIPPSVSANT
jgi:catechol 2,3-dioxygenase-like lactoylglutathione lyase family enzyme